MPFRVDRSGSEFYKWILNHGAVRRSEVSPQLNIELLWGAIGSMITQAAVDSEMIFVEQYFGEDMQDGKTYDEVFLRTYFRLNEDELPAHVLDEALPSRTVEQLETASTSAFTHVAGINQFLKERKLEKKLPSTLEKYFMAIVPRRTHDEREIVALVFKRMHEIVDVL